MPTCIATGVNGKDGVHCRAALRKLREKERGGRRYARPPGSDPNPPKKQPDGAKDSAPARKSAGRPAGKSKFSEKTIIALVKENPRRAGTHGQKSFDIILRAGGSIKYEDYKERGGRNNDLQWDIDRKYVEIK
jgi:hypothetical protein